MTATAKASNTIRKRALVHAPWRSSRLLSQIFKLAAAASGEARVVGGAVRNALLGMPINDVDVATDLLPEQIIDHATRAGISVYPTGIEHGTVTLGLDGETIEVTTLRRDIATDGRRAVVAFTRAWSEDALRRDFTINALSCDADGTVYDCVGGLDDIAKGRVRFIGDAHDRIREDYLRILRFFRFTAYYTAGACDAAGLAACTALKDGLHQLSAERISAEATKIVLSPRAAEMALIMDHAGILRAVIALTPRPDRLRRLMEIESALGIEADLIARLSALFMEIPADAETLASALRLSNAQRDALEASAEISGAHTPQATIEDAHRAIYKSGQDTFARAVRIAWARSGASASDAAWHERAHVAAHWSAPRMPFSGGDVIALGIPPGPRVGRTLRAFEAWWIAENFPNDTNVQRARLAALAEQS
jgi:poly(A) polymerase